MPAERRDEELAALVGGPWSGCWFWLSDLKAQQATERDRVDRGLVVPFPKARYEPTEEWLPNPDGKSKVVGIHGRVWRWAS